MKTIDISTPTYPGAIALVDEDDYESVAAFKWHMCRNGYAARTLPRPLHGVEYLHRRIMGNPDGIVDHSNRDKLDNRRSNLRVTGRQGNAANMRTKAKCGLKGVTYHPQTGKWRARVMKDGKQICLGLHPTPEQAHEAYVKAAKIAFGEFARAA